MSRSRPGEERSPVAGASDCVTKTVDAGHLIERIQHWPSPA
ncbi:hypothetical protein [Nonomuraea jiangxiensis]|nr:hypothetical protein [Nonomuraea jiangxiensis]